MVGKESAGCEKGRSKLIVWNIVISFLVKGWSSIVIFLMVPLTLNCLGTYQNGVWLTISSLLVWIDQMDIGLGNGLRNRLAIHVAHGEWMEARKVVSSTVAMLICIVFPVLLCLLMIIWKTDVYSLLNVAPNIIPELRLALLCGVALVCMTFVLKFIGNVYMGLQMPAVSNLLIVFGQTFALIGTWLLYMAQKATFLNIVVVNTAAPLLVYVLVYPYTFFYRYPALRPSFRLVNLRSALELGNLGVKFFWLQIAGVVQFMSINILISQFFTPELVTPYQIVHRYMSLAMVVFSVVCMPFWNATTDAYEQGDIAWIRKADRKMTIMSAAIGLLMLLMVLVSPWVYDIWIGEACQIPYGMTVIMAVYIYLMILSMRYSYFLNGIGALRLQLYMTFMTFVFIPVAWIVSRQTHNILWFMGVMCLCVLPSILANMIQFKKFLNGTAKGIWKIC